MITIFLYIINTIIFSISLTNGKYIDLILPSFFTFPIIWAFSKYFKHKKLFLEEEIKEEIETIEIELDEKVLLDLALMAHEQDITLNQLIINILKSKLQMD